ncbi:glycosyltransferase family 4 protein [Flavihumibacter profundi]|jgi:glycosyltransferase involved in cell wall biosynthesis|uniref:glycosyltransferase family 4 protein n=1 Tax=Flavihumibacter profundi TaxID=2716883 RepID=UPI001CC592D8|nr:glycosyltransferase family 4 protein [Flavihumibacter profundi]MBZ5855774.1 glycosyltransferase family 4 protein [Flavihumibacter profundi]
MKILMLVPGLPLDTNKIKGGVHSATINLLNGFKEEKAQVRLLAFTNEVKEVTIRNFSDTIDIYFIPEGKMPYHALNYLFACRKHVEKQYRSFQPDIIHFELGGAFLLSSLCRIDRKKMVLTVHGIAFGEAKISTTWRRKLMCYYNGYLERLLLPKHVVQLSEYSNKLFNSWKGGKADTCIIPNAIKADYFQIPPIGQVSGTILYLGILYDRKNIMLLLYALKKLVENNMAYRLEVVGGYLNEEYKEQVENYIKENKLEQYIHFNGWLTQPEVIEKLNEIDILVITSKQETLPMAIAEAMAAGRVVVGTDVGGIPEMIDNNENGFVFTEGSESGLYSILASLYKKDDKVKQIGAAAKIKAQNTYFAARVARETLNFYQTIIRA